MVSHLAAHLSCRRATKDQRIRRVKLHARLDGSESNDEASAVNAGSPAYVASPGTYDHKHVARIAGVESCVAYGPGELEQAHQPDEWCGVEDMVDSAKVMALTLHELLG